MSKPKLTWSNFKKDKMFHIQLLVLVAAVILVILARMLLA